MAERKRRRVSEDIVELDEDSGILLEPTEIELGSGYTLAVSFDENEKPVVNIKTYGRVDLVRLRREIHEIFPDAQIRQNGQPQTVTVSKKSKRKLDARKKQSR